MVEVEGKVRKTVQSRLLGTMLKLSDSLDPETSMLLPSGGEYKDKTTLDQYPVTICSRTAIISLRNHYARLIAYGYVDTLVYSKN